MAGRNGVVEPKLRGCITNPQGVPMKPFVRWAVVVVVFLVVGAFAGPDRHAADHPQAQPAVAPRPDRAAFMRQHFELVTVVHDAVTRGDLPTARRQAAVLADGRDPPDLPVGAAPIVATMRRAAARAATAVGLDDMAAAASTMLATCGSCHRAVGTMPAPAMPPSPVVGGQVGHMLAHQHAVDLMAQGLTVPSASLWQRGAEALESAPLRKAVVPKHRGLTDDLVAAEQSVHQLAARARAASDERARIDVYSALLQRCATCHARYGGVAGPDKR